MSTTPYEILARKRAGEPLSEAAIREVVTGAASGSWGDAELAAFLMAAVIRGMDAAETRALTLAMLESGERWGLAADLPGVADKHSTGGVGDKVSLVLAPLLAACGVPVVMLTGRALGHSGGTADKLESIPGLRLELDRARCLEVARATGLAIGVATAEIAPADRRLYALRDRTATVESLPLMTASILSKKLATGAAAVVFDVKLGSGAFLPDRERAGELARLLTETACALGTPAAALLTDMSQPLGRWVGHAAEVNESLEALAGGGAPDLMEVTYALALEAAALAGRPLEPADLERAIAGGAARERFLRWAQAQGAEPAWLRAPALALAPEEMSVAARRAGVVAAMDTRRLGLLLAEAGAGRLAGGALDPGVALDLRARLGDRVAAGAELCRLHLRRRDEGLAARVAECFTIGDRGASPPLIVGRVAPASRE
jgi:pyrimidine-nucleoside phosphorylase